MNNDGRCPTCGQLVYLPRPNCPACKTFWLTVAALAWYGLDRLIVASLGITTRRTPQTDRTPIPPRRPVKGDPFMQDWDSEAELAGVFDLVDAELERVIRDWTR